MGAPLPSPRGDLSNVAKLVAAASVVVLASCGELTTEVDKPTRLVTVTTSATAHDLGDRKLRLSLVWRTTDKTFFAPSDDAPITDTKAPIAFDVRRPPPESALHAQVLVASEGTPMRFAHAGFVIYTDGNGDDTLTFAIGRAEAAAGDVIVGANPDVTALWLERAPSETEATILSDVRGTVPRPGLNFLRSTADGPLWMRANETIDLGAPNRIGWPERVCSYVFESPIPAVGATVYDLDRSFPPSGAQGLACGDKGRSMSFQGCIPVGLCSAATSCAVRVRRVAGAEGPPLGWPCPIE